MYKPSHFPTETRRDVLILTIPFCRTCGWPIHQSDPEVGQDEGGCILMSCGFCGASFESFGFVIGEYFGPVDTPVGEVLASARKHATRPALHLSDEQKSSFEAQEVSLGVDQRPDWEKPAL